MAVKNNWLTPLQRSYDSIKQTILNKMKRDVPEMNDTSEGNIFVMIISIFSAIAEVLHYYIDNMGRETFFITARRFSSLYKHAKLVDYHIMAATPANIDILLYLEDSDGNIEEYGPETPIFIPGSITFTSDDGKEWQMHSDVFWGENEKSGLFNKTRYCTISLWQKRHIGQQVLGTVNAANQVFYLGDLTTGELYVEDSMVLKVGETPWSIVNTFAYSSPDDNHFMVDIDLSGKPFVRFGDGVHGKRPQSGQLVYVEYDVTYGAKSNIPANSFNTVPSEILEKDGRVKILSSNQAVGGNDFESFNQIKDHLPLSIKTLGVIITKEDYISYIRTIPGIDKVYVKYDCGKKLYVYLIADGGVTTQAIALEEKVVKMVDRVKVITTEVFIKWATDAQIFITLSVTGRKSYRADDIRNQVLTALLGEYSFQNSDIGREIRLSDIYSLIEGQSTVDYLEIHSLDILKRPTPVVDGLPVLVVNDFNLVSWDTEGWGTDSQTVFTNDDELYTGQYIRYLIEITGSSKYKVVYLYGGVNGDSSKDILIKDNIPLDTLQTLSSKYNKNGERADATFQINLSSKGQARGNKYYLDIYNTLSSQVMSAPGITIPILTKDNIKLTVNEIV